MEKRDSDLKIVLVLGAALFSMFFGAGNLIFPPVLGLHAGTQWHIALFGFFLTGIGLTITGVIASAKAGGNMNEIGNRVSPLFSKFFGITIVICLGPLMAVPRTGATAYEISILPITDKISPILFAIVYFGITWLLVMKPTDIVDRVGKILTPGLILILAGIIIKGIIDPIGRPIDPIVPSAFPFGFIEGYQTMDALGSMLFGGIVINTLRSHGINEPKKQFRLSIFAGLVAGVLLLSVYGGLAFLGSRAGTVVSSDIPRVELIMILADHSLKAFGRIGLSIVVTLACLTTAVALSSTVGTYFDDLTNGRLKYNWVATITVFFSAIMSVNGVEKIVNFSGPILVFMYPLMMVMVILTMFLDNKPNRNIYRGAILMAFIFSGLSMLESFGVGSFPQAILSKMPLYSWNMPWLIPAVIGGIVGGFIEDKTCDGDCSSRDCDKC